MPHSRTFLFVGYAQLALHLALIVIITSAKDGIYCLCAYICLSVCLSVSSLTQDVASQKLCDVTSEAYSKIKR